MLRSLLLRACLLAALCLAMGCDSVELPERSPLDPLSDAYVPPAPTNVQARYSPRFNSDGPQPPGANTVTVEWKTASEAATALEVQQSLGDDTSFVTVARLPPTATQWSAQAPLAFGARYRVMTVNERGGEERRSASAGAASVSFFDQAKFQVQLHALSENALFVNVSPDLVRLHPDYRLSFRRYTDGVAGEEQAVALSALISSRTVFPNSGFGPLGDAPYTWIDSLDTRTGAVYRYDVRLLAGEQQIERTTEPVTMPPAWPTPPVLSASVVSQPTRDNGISHIVVQLLHSLPQLGTSLTIIERNDLGEERLVGSYSLGGPPPLGYIPSGIVQYPAATTDRARTFTYYIVLPNGERFSETRPLRYDTKAGRWVI